ncbi:GNAT family N-acetyltransferase [Tropicimonas sp.]|uniref:GNAT family N-acetyltransferase n=1 Tax=Tropicimonas sp. TaxID=2067044 RepID=UPI003A853561
MRAPVLETDRLFLRRPSIGDIGTLLAALRAGQPHIGSAPLSGMRALAQSVPIACHWDICGLGLFAVVPKGCDTPAGLAGPWHATGWPAPELGFLFFDTPDADTLLPEALHAVRAFAEHGIGWREAVTLVASGDRRAAALLRTSGAIADPFADGPAETLIFCHPVRPQRTARLRRAA